jgi:signal recognition particle subunit SRP54
MFEHLSNKLSVVIKKLTGQGKLNEKNIEDALKEVRMALLEADVHYKVVKEFIEKVKVRAIGKEVLSSLTPGQQVIKIVNEELTKIMGDQKEDLVLSGPVPIPIMLVGIQGSGKTTTAGKLASHLRGKGRKPYLVPADLRRPAAIEQLVRLAKQINVPVYQSETGKDPVEICEKALLSATQQDCDTVIIDTAGRLHVDQELMDELIRIKNSIKPSDILLVADAMTGQDAVNIAKAFDQALAIGGVILTKMDGDARGGAALSIRSVTQKPIKFVGVGEKNSELTPFYPQGMASRILGMGDMLSFIEQAEATFDKQKMAEIDKKLKKNKFTLEDFRDQMSQVKKMGSFKDVISMIPGYGSSIDIEKAGLDKELSLVEAIVNSMTPKERENPAILNGSRRKRIAQGSGTKVQDVNELVKGYNGVLAAIKRMNKGVMPNFFRRNKAWFK